ncbi:MAG: pseudouridine synthase [Candidatus Falkowbacteria bacterium]|nr:pseudouridine synthase [Candidatus Falkowbacteria bacterium]
MKDFPLQKVIASRSGLSRRDAEALIKEGKVEVDDVVAEAGRRVPEDAEIRIKGRRLAQAPTNFTYIALNKPAGYTCTSAQFSGEQNIFSLVPFKEKLFAIGRLDKDSRGLLILTNDGDFAQRLSHPRYEHEKTYRVNLASPRDVEWNLRDMAMIENELLSGVKVPEEERPMKAVKIEHLQNGAFVITLNEGRKRQIRRMFEALGYAVKDLIRINLAGIDLGSLAEGKWRPLSEEEIKRLKK